MGQWTNDGIIGGLFVWLADGWIVGSMIDGWIYAGFLNRWWVVGSVMYCWVDDGVLDRWWVVGSMIDGWIDDGWMGGCFLLVYW